MTLGSQQAGQQTRHLSCRCWSRASWRSRASSVAFLSSARRSSSARRCAATVLRACSSSRLMDGVCWGGERHSMSTVWADGRSQVPSKTEGWLLRVHQAPSKADNKAHSRAATSPCVRPPQEEAHLKRCSVPSIAPNSRLLRRFTSALSSSNAPSAGRLRSCRSASSTGATTEDRLGRAGSGGRFGGGRSSCHTGHTRQGVLARMVMSE